MPRSHPDSGLTLRESFERFYDKEDLTCRTVQKIRHTVNLWEKLTSNPAVRDIDNATVAAFKAAVLESHTGNTFNSHWTSIRAILRRLAPPILGNPAGLSIIESVPYVKRAKVVHPLPRRIPLEDLTRFYVSARHAQYPRIGVSPADYWRAMLVLCYFTALRKSDLLMLTWEEVDLQQGRIRFRSQKTGKPDEFLLHPCAVTHLQRIYRPSGRVFGGMYWRGTRFYNVWREIIEHAKCERFTLHDVRRTAGSEIERSPIGRGLARVFLQHAPRGVTDASYVNRMEELGEAILAMRVPPGWKPGPKMAQRAEEKQRVDRALIRADEFHIPYGANSADWQFADWGFRFRGSQWFKMFGRKLALLRAFVESGEPLGVGELQKILGVGPRGALDVHPRVADLRNRLRAALGLEDGWDPLPCIARGRACPGGAWTLHIPPNIKVPVDAA